MAQHRMFAKGIEHLGAGDIDWASNTIKYALLTSSATITPATDEFFDSIDANEVANGNGYTTGGVTLASKTLATVDDAAVSAWQASTAYDAGDIVRPTSADGHIYLCITAGTTGGTEPTWQTGFGENTSDGTAEWVQAGDSYLKFDAANAQWTSSTITARYGVCYVAGSTPGTDDYLIAYLDFGQNESSDNGTFEVQFHSTGIHRIFRAA